MKTVVDKLKSRKLWAAVAGIVTGLAMIFGLDETVMNTVSGAVVAVASVVTYIVTEGKIDAAAVGNAAQEIQDAIEVIGFELPSEEEIDE